MSMPSRVEELFCAALEKSSFAERVACLDEACRDDPELRRRVFRLLRAHHSAGDFLETPPEDLGSTFSTSPMLCETVGARIGHYTLVQQIGEGGMGTVFLAEAEGPVKRRVALKILRPGMNSAQVLRRFDAERQSLSLMDHPNIAQVLDAGVTPLGRPYFVMELVSGVSIGQYCDDHRLPLRDRLRLFLDVCHAIQHAHLKGIIHRDLKPSNVLICLREGQATAKVIDFGVAKVLFQQLSGESMHTEIGQIIGTLEYMSPEQAGLSEADIDTRADIYSLGVLLYELLTGTTPLHRQALRSVALSELLRRIREVEPPRSSSRLAQCGAALASIAAQRGTDPARLLRQVRGELDWIVMKCLELDRTRRYETVVALAQDIQRQLDGEAVEAGPPSAIYRFRKLARRHRAPVLAATMVLVSLVGGIIGTSWGLARAHASAAAEQRSNQRLGAANQQLVAANANLSRSREETEQKRQAAEREQVLAQSVNEFMQELLGQADSDAQANQGFEPDPNLTVKQALFRAASRVGEQFQDQPRVEAATRQTIGVALTRIGEPDAAVPHLERALVLWQAESDADDDRLECLVHLATAYDAGGHCDKSLALLEPAVLEAEKMHGPDDELTLLCMNNLAGVYARLAKFDQAVKLLESMRQRTVQRYGPDAKPTLAVLNNLAFAYEGMGQLDKALPMFEQLADQGSQTAMNSLVLAYSLAGHPEKALPVSERLVAQTRQGWGPDHPYTLSAMNGLAIVYYRIQQYDQAFSLLDEVLTQREKSQGADHPDTLASMHNLARLYHETGQFEKALPLAEQVVQKQNERFGPGNLGTLSCSELLAAIYCSIGRADEGIALFEQTIARIETELGPDHPLRSQALHELGVIYAKRGEFQKAIARLEAVVNPGPKTIMPLALAYGRIGQPETAERMLEACLARLRTQSLADPSGAPDASVRKLAAPVLASITLADDSDLPNVLVTLATMLMAQQKCAEAEPVLRECLAKRTELAADDWRTFNAQSLLGESLLSQQKYAEAEPLLTGGYEGLKRREATIPPELKSRVPQALERLVRLYEDWGKPDEAAKWRNEQQAAPTDERSVGS